MDIQIRPLTVSDIDDLVELSLLAWAPVFRSFEQVLGSEIYGLLYPHWQQSQEVGVRTVCSDSGKYTVWVAEMNKLVVGFIAYELNTTDKTGEIDLLAVHPEYQNRGIGTELNMFALEKLRASGMELAMLSTGGDPGHAPARRTYEKAGYTPMPLIRYYKSLQQP